MLIKYFAVLIVLMAASVTGFSQGSGVLKALEPQGPAADEAKANGYHVVRILPRGLFPEEGSLRGGGAYFSFSKNSHDYNDTPQLSLELNKLHIGFAGADYGMITRLGSVPLEKVNRSLTEVKQLVAYRPAATEFAARAEYQRLNVDPSKALWSKNANVVVGSTYLLRAVSYGEADTAVAFRVISQEPDGGVTIAWKKISEFSKPILKRTADR